MPASSFPPDLPTLPATPDGVVAQQAAPPRRGLWRQVAGAIGWNASPAADPIDPKAAGRALVACLADLPTEKTAVLRQLLAHAKSPVELGYLRPEVYRLLSLHHSQDEAERRLVALDPGFDSRLRRTRPGSELPPEAVAARRAARRAIQGRIPPQRTPR